MKAIRHAYTRHPWFALVLDIVVVLFFATRGRVSHEMGIDVSGILSTGMPFLTALLLGWVALLLVGRNGSVAAAPTRLWLGGIVIWAFTVAGGVLLRVLAGDTAAMPFVLVTAGVLAALFLLPRLLLHSDRALRATAAG